MDEKQHYGSEQYPPMESLHSQPNTLSRIANGQDVTLMGKRYTIIHTCLGCKDYDWTQPQCDSCVTDCYKAKERI